MNKRIRELEKQATEIVKCGLNGSSTTESFSRKKFAELIIQECISLCANVECDDELSDYDGGFKDGALLCQQEIKQYFGVE